MHINPKLIKIIYRELLARFLRHRLNNNHSSSGHQILYMSQSLLDDRLQTVNIHVLASVLITRTPLSVECRRREELVLLMSLPSPNSFTNLYHKSLYLGSFVFSHRFATSFIFFVVMCFLSPFNYTIYIISFNFHFRSIGSPRL